MLSVVLRQRFILNVKYIDLHLLSSPINNLHMMTGTHAYDCQRLPFTAWPQANGNNTISLTPFSIIRFIHGTWLQVRDQYRASSFVSKSRTKGWRSAAPVDLSALFTFHASFCWKSTTNVWRDAQFMWINMLHKAL